MTSNLRYALALTVSGALALCIGTLTGNVIRDAASFHDVPRHSAAATHPQNAERVPGIPVHAEADAHSEVLGTFTVDRIRVYCGEGSGEWQLVVSVDETVRGYARVSDEACRIAVHSEADTHSAVLGSFDVTALQVFCGNPAPDGWELVGTSDLSVVGYAEVSDRKCPQGEHWTYSHIQGHAGWQGMHK